MVHENVIKLELLEEIPSITAHLDGIRYTEPEDERRRFPARSSLRRRTSAGSGLPAGRARTQPPVTICHVICATL